MSTVVSTKSWVPRMRPSLQWYGTSVHLLYLIVGRAVRHTSHVNLSGAEQQVEHVRLTQSGR